MQDLLNGNIILLSQQLCLEDHTKGAVADDLAVGVGQLACLSRLAVGGNNLDDFMGVVDRCLSHKRCVDGLRLEETVQSRQQKDSSEDGCVVCMDIGRTIRELA